MCVYMCAFRCLFLLSATLPYYSTYYYDLIIRSKPSFIKDIDFISTVYIIYFYSINCLCRVCFVSIHNIACRETVSTV